MMFAICNGSSSHTVEDARRFANRLDPLLCRVNAINRHFGISL